MQQYLQHEHYALWEVIEFGDSYEAPANDPSTTTTKTTSGEAGTKSGRTVTLTKEDMQKKKNDVKARTTLLLSLLDEHQLRFMKYKTARELWAAILKTFSSNEATKKTKKNLLKQQYGNFRAEGSKTLEQTFTRLQVIVGQLQFMDVEVKQDDLNQKFLTSLAPEWLMHTIVWRNRSDLDTMSLDDLGNNEVNTASVYTASSNVPTASANVATISISQETACAYIASQSSGSQIKFEDINQIDEDDTKEMDIKWNMALLSMRADKAPRNQDRGRRDNYRQREDHALVTDEEAPTEFALMANTSTKSKNLEYYHESKKECIESLRKELETLKQEKEVVDGKLAGLLTASKDVDNLIESQRSSPTIESSSEEDQNKSPYVFENVASPITPKPIVNFIKASDSQSKNKTDEMETPKKPPVKYAEQYRKLNKKPNVRGNQRNWNNLKSHQLGPDFVMKKKSCFNCGDFNHLAYECRKRVKGETTRNFPPVNRKFSTGRRNFPTVNRKFSTASRKFPTGSIKNPTADMGMKGKAVKPLACWTWKPSQNLSNKGLKNNSVSMMFKKYTYIDTQGYWVSGCSRHMTGNISYLSDYEPFDGGYVSFGQGGCKITRKGTIKTVKFEFENVYFVKDL
nr:hypothetical protein [Tanacetum cinerariifolium]